MCIGSDNPRVLKIYTKYSTFTGLNINDRILNKYYYFERILQEFQTNRIFLMKKSLSHKTK